MSPARRAISVERVSGRNRAYTFSVMSVLPCPNRRLTTDMDNPLLSAKTANVCLATCMVSGNLSSSVSPTTVSDWLMHLVALFLALYNASSLSISRLSLTKSKTYRLLPLFSLQILRIPMAGSVRGMMCRLPVLEIV